MIWEYQIKVLVEFDTQLILRKRFGKTRRDCWKKGFIAPCIMTLGDVSNVQKNFVCINSTRII